MNLTRILTDYENPASLGSRLRRRRAAPLVALVGALRPPVRVLDVGGTPAYWKILPGGIRGKMELVFLNKVALRAPGSQFVKGDGCALPFGDDAFDIVHSNSVIEHVGDWRAISTFANEIQRVGKHHFVQTPNYWCPIEPHFMSVGFQWMPRPAQVCLLMHHRHGSYEKSQTFDEAERVVDKAPRLVTRKEFQHLFPNSHHITEWIGPFPKSLIAWL